MTKSEHAAELARAFRAFLEGEGGQWDWDDATSCRIGDPKLDGLRREAAAVELPLDEQGRSTIERLAKKAEALSQP